MQSFANDSAGRVKTLTVLKRLSATTETVVRERAVVSMSEIIALCEVVDGECEGVGDGECVVSMSEIIALCEVVDGECEMGGS